MFGPSFLTAHGDVLMDIVIMSLLIIIPALIVSIRLLRVHKNYIKHRNIQMGLFATLIVAVSLFEYNLANRGGIWEMTKTSRYAGTNFLRYNIYTHMGFSFSTSLLWILTTIFSLIIFRQKLGPNNFSPIHKKIGWLTVFFTVGTGLTGAWVYYIGFNN